MSGVILPLQRPRLVGYGHHAFPLSIISNSDDYLPWFYSNYIQLFGVTATNKIDFYLDLHVADSISFTTNPWLIINKINRNNIADHRKTIVPYIQHALSQHNYVYTFVDEYHISEKPAYHEEHVLSDILIHGYEPGKNIFFASGFNGNKVYGTFTLSFEEFMAAYIGFENRYPSVHELDERRSSVYLMKYNRNASYNIDFNYIIQLLKEYAYAYNSSERFRLLKNPVPDSINVFGITIYSFLENYIERVINKEVVFKVDAAHILWEHKKCMVERLRYLQENYGFPEAKLIQSFQAIEEKTLAMRNLFIKFLVTRNEKHLMKAKGMIGAIAKQEIECIEQLVKVIQGRA